MNLEQFKAKAEAAKRAGIEWAVDPTMILGLCETVMRLQAENEALRSTLTEYERHWAEFETWRESVRSY